jgi:hypothetical protein
MKSYGRPPELKTVVARKRDTARLVKATLIQILRRGSIVDTDDPLEMALACSAQEKIAARIERELDR